MNRFAMRLAVTVVLLSHMTRQPVIAAQPATAAVAGVVVDAHTRQPLAGALVELGGATRAIATDVEGRFRFDAVPLGSRELIVSLVGYALVKQTVDLRPAGIDVTVALTEGAAAFNEQVTVHGSVFGVRELGVAGQQSLSSGELRQLGGMTLDDPLRAVQALAGANASDDFYGELAVRGNGFRDLTYTLNGAPARFLLHTTKLLQDGGSVSMINSDVLDHASLLRGAYPQRFNSRLGAHVERRVARAPTVQPDGERDERVGDRRRAARFGSWFVARVRKTQLP
jgi:CarboxypepD_reg-like domain